MRNGGGSPTIENCVFSGNTGASGETYGAGMCNVDSSPTISGCIFENSVALEGPSARSGRGGGMYNENSTVTLTDCAFVYNRDPDSDPDFPDATGGGIYNASGTDCTLVNCVFVANSSAQGTLRGSSGSTSTLYNCTFCSNEAAGGILYCIGTITVYNSILWDNNFFDYPATEPSAGIVYNAGGTITITYSDVEGGYSGTGNIDTDPQLVTYPSYTPNVPGDLATCWYNSTSRDFGDLHLSSGSPCIDAANNGDVPSGTSTDTDGRTRILDGHGGGSGAPVFPDRTGPIRTLTRVRPRDCGVPCPGQMHRVVTSAWP